MILFLLFEYFDYATKEGALERSYKHRLKQVLEDTNAGIWKNSSWKKNFVMKKNNDIVSIKGPRKELQGRY